MSSSQNAAIDVHHYCYCCGHYCHCHHFTSTSFATTTDNVISVVSVITHFVTAFLLITKYC